MKAGIWAEIEVANAASKIWQKDDSWFLCRDGTRIVVGSRAFLNFGQAKVRRYAHKVIDRLVRNYGIAYLKLDYNADHGAGDNSRTSSLGLGQMGHVRGFYQWLEELHQNHPELIVENCGSGGMRMDYGLLSRTQVQSTSDQTRFQLYPSIMAGALAAVLPEQAAVWSYPLPDQTDEQVATNLVSPMLGRWHLAGRIDQIPDHQKAMVRAATDCWKKGVRRFTPRMTPFWPTPRRNMCDQKQWLAVGLRDAAGTHAFISVFRLDSDDDTVTLPLDSLNLPAGAKAEVLFPTNLGGSVKLDRRAGVLHVTLPDRYGARLIEIRAK
jgi:alpha-galactosidase